MPRIELGLPARPFLYTLDQVADLFGIELLTLRRSYIYFDGVSTGTKPKDRMLARQIEPEGEPRTWRVAEEELKRWLRYMGFRVYDRSSVRV